MVFGCIRNGCKFRISKSLRQNSVQNGKGAGIFSVKIAEKVVFLLLLLSLSSSQMLEFNRYKSTIIIQKELQYYCFQQSTGNIIKKNVH